MRFSILQSLAAAILFNSSRGTVAFSPASKATIVKNNQRRGISSLSASISRIPVAQQENIDTDFFMTKDEIKPIVTLGKEPKTKSVNLFGAWALAVSLVICPIWYAALKMCSLSYDIFGDDWDPNREFYDGLGKIWANAFLTATNSMPSYSGELQLLRKGPHNKPCLFVANHASWLDVPVLCTCTDQVFKFVSKAELGKLPCIGDQLEGGNHVLIDRDDRRSQLRSFKESIAWIKKGVPLVAFPEGRRSDDGKLLEFKGGVFAIAAKCKIPIVPITLSHTHAVMPSSALFPVQAGAGKLHVHVHPEIDVEGRTEEELGQMVKDCFMETLPRCQYPAVAPEDGKSDVKIPQREEELQVS